MRLDSDVVRVDRSTSYSLAGVFSFGRGLFSRGLLSGSETRYSTLHRLRQDQFVLSKLKAWEGAVAVVDGEFAGSVLSPEFPAFTIDARVLLPSYLSLVCGREDFWRLLQQQSRGMGGRRERVHPRQLLEVRIELPPLAEQRRIVDLAAAIDSFSEAATRRSKSGSALVRALGDDLFCDADTDWLELPLVECVEVLDRFRRPINSAERAKRPGDVPYYGASGQAGWIDDYLFDEPLVLLGEDAVDFLNPNAQKAYLISGPAWVNNHAHVLRARSEVVTTEFLALALNRVNYSKYASFGTRSKLTQASMLKIRLRVPPLDSQLRIAATIQAGEDERLASDEVSAAARRSRTAIVSQLLAGYHEIPDSYDVLLDVSA